jgi:quinol monooxygenase YgiN
MILATLKIAVAPDRRAGVVEVFSSLLGPVRVEPGCLFCELYQDASNDGDILYVEEWETSEQHERHMRSARYERLLAIMEASENPPVLRYYSISDVRGLEYLELIRLGIATPPAASGGEMQKG